MVATGTLACSKPTTETSSERLGEVNSCLIFMLSTAKVYPWRIFRSLRHPLLRWSLTRTSRESGLVHSRVLLPLVPC